MMILYLLSIPAAAIMLIYGGFPVGKLSFGAYHGKVVSGHPLLMRVAALLLVWMMIPMIVPWGGVGVAVLGSLALFLIIVGLFLGR
ncbi:hypothetical protein KQI52_05555 [bacterium]|nr:hypothetical protein [bacterium]